MKRRQTERLDEYHGMKIANESSKLPGHEERMQEHAKRVEAEKNKKVS